MNKQRIPVREAAKILGVGQEEVRYRMEKGTLPIGNVLPPKKKGGYKRYWIFKAKLMEYVGLEEWPEENK